MNTFTGLLLLMWIGGWTFAMVRAGLKARAVAIAPVSGKKLPKKSGIFTG